MRDVGRRRGMTRVYIESDVTDGAQHVSRSPRLALALFSASRFPALRSPLPSPLSVPRLSKFPAARQAGLVSYVCTCMLLRARLPRSNLGRDLPLGATQALKYRGNRLTTADTDGEWNEDEQPCLYNEMLSFAESE